ncbi:MAG: ArsR family transcriptional regulator [Phycisphaerales bacterium]
MARTESSTGKRGIRFVGLVELIGEVRCRTRLEVLIALARSPSSVSALAERLELEISHVSHMLGELESAGLVGHIRVAQRCVYSIGPMLVVAFEGEAGKRQSATLTLTGDTGSAVTLWVSPDELEALERRTGALVPRRDPSTQSAEIKPATLSDTITPAAGPVPPGNAPIEPHSASGPG